MSKTKAWFVAAIIMTLAGGFIYCSWSWQIRSYYTVMQILGWYGFIVGGVHLAGWLAKDEAKHEEKRSYAEWAAGWRARQ